MITKKIGDREFQITDTYQDMYLWQYMRYAEMNFQTNELDSIKQVRNAIEMIEIFCNLKEEDNDITIGVIEELSQAIVEIVPNFNDQNVMNNLLEKSFIINDTLYITRNVDNIKDLTTDEYLSLATLDEKYKDFQELWPRKLAVLIRPGSIEIDAETQKETYKIEPFNEKDLMNLEFRAELFKKQLKAYNAIPCLNFFLTIKQA